MPEKQPLLAISFESYLNYVMNRPSRSKNELLLGEIRRGYLGFGPLAEATFKGVTYGKVRTKLGTRSPLT